MSAELLRQAADRLDEVTGAATPGPWVHEPAPNGFAPVVIGGGMAVAETFDKPHLSDAAYIATMSPPVAKALAAWLRSEVGLHHLGQQHSPALAVARAVLGEANSGEGRGGAVSERGES